MENKNPLRLSTSVYTRCRRDMTEVHEMLYGLDHAKSEPASELLRNKYQLKKKIC